MTKLYNPETNIVNWDIIIEIPEFKMLSKTPQNILWHMEGDAFIHTKMVVNNMLTYIEIEEHPRFLDLEYKQILVYSALLHDIGKTITTKKGEDGLYHCKDHVIKGIPIAERILEMYVPEINDYSKKAILSLIRLHMQPLYILTHKYPEKQILKLVNNLENVLFEDLLLLKKCDCKGSISKKYDGSLETLEKVKNLFYKVCSYPSKTKVELEKIKSINNYSNKIYTGYKTIGYLINPITKGFRTSLGFKFSTSPVEVIISKNQFQTKNGIYKITELINDEDFNNN